MAVKLIGWILHQWEREMSSTVAQSSNHQDPRLKISAARRMLFRNGIDSHIGGHVSLRVPGEAAFLVSPSEYFDETLPQHILKVGFDLRVIEQGAYGGQPGINFHADIYRARPDVNCVIHTHGHNAAVLSTLHAEPVAYHANGALFQDDVVLFHDDPNATPDAEGAAIAASIGQKRALLIANHGVVHVGETLEQTTAEVIMFDLAAGVQLAAMAVGGKPMPAATARTYRDLFLKISYRNDLWDANFRRLKRSDPDLFDTI
jgi:L-fuculose-phosphate aldolase